MLEVPGANLGTTRQIGDRLGEMEDGHERIPSWVGRDISVEELDPAVGLAAEDSDEAPLDVAGGSGSPRPRWRPTVLVGGGLIIAIAIGILAFIAALRLGNDTESVDTAAEPTPGAAQAARDENTESSASTTSSVASTTPTTSVSDVPVAMVEAYQGQAWTAGEAAWIVQWNGAVHLQGQVPDQRTADDLEERLQAALDRDDVVVELVIDPVSPMPVDPPLFISGTIEFAPNSADVLPGGSPDLVDAVTLMNLNTAAALGVVLDGSLLADGGAPADLAQRRMAAVLEHLEGQGIHRSRLNTEHRNLDRGGVGTTVEPVEFVMRGLLTQT